MPLYEYECTACHRRTEKIQKFSDAELTECPFCGQRLERTLTAPAVHFAGGGWYKDLYSSSKPAASSGEGSSGEGGSGEAKTGEAKTGDTKAGGSEASTSGSSASDKPAAAAAAPAPAASTPKAGT